MLQRRGLLFGLLAAPAIIRTPGLLMPVRPAVTSYLAYPIWTEAVRLEPPEEWPVSTLPDYFWRHPCD